MPLFQPKKESNHAPLTGIESITVMGGGCKNCRALLENAEAAAANLKLDVPVAYVTDMAQIAQTGAMQMPALMINQTVVSGGKVLKCNEIEVLLQKFGNVSIRG